MDSQLLSSFQAMSLQPQQPQRVAKIKPKKAAEPLTNEWWPEPQRIPITLGEEVAAALAEWYGTRGKPVPEEYRGIAQEVDAQRAEELAAEERVSDMITRGVVKVVDASGEVVEKVIAAGAKPEFGTPEFWKWARQRAMEKNAERAAAGLPPLPTKKEKEAAKAAKAAAKAAKAAAKA